MSQVFKSFVSCILLAASAGCSALSEFSPGALDTALNAADVPGLNDPETINNGMKIAKGVTLTDAEVIEEAHNYAMASDKHNKVAAESNPYNLRLQRLVRRHIREDGLKLDFKVYLSPQFNAFALANGSIRVYSGMMDRLTDAELLSVIGHEIGHVKLGHSKAQLSKALMLEGASKLGTAYAGNKASSSLGAGLGSVGDNVVKNAVDGAGEKVMEVVMAKFSREDELAADDYGMQFLKRNKYDQKSAIRALNKVAVVSEEESALAFLTASHPDPKSRAERLAKQLGTAETLSDSPAPVKAAVKDLPAPPAVKAEPPAKSGKAAAVLHTPKLTSYRGWVIQVTAETDEVIAREKVSTLAESGVKAEVQEAQVRGTTYFRVLVGPYRSKESAQQDLDRITNFGVNVGQPFIKAFSE